MFTKKNLNPTGKKKSDCVIRAIMSATGKTWTEIYDGLTAIGREKFNIPNSKEVYEEYLRRLGWEKYPMPKYNLENGRYKRYTAHEFAGIQKDNKIIMSLANHLTASSYGDIIDTWDCGNKSVGNYWKK